ncbi:response regulator transcription factor [Butyrivibrio sp. WCD2001]|uniref:response regulator transcription factor n=1 Tax=Butyrivibrio sp. WCD2001 TaxID=1280681 RepID=UPI0005D2A0EC|nr:response regulator [Butyrivibrio sp. WCD2001]
MADDEPIERQVVNKKIMRFFPDLAEVHLAENGLRAVELYEEKKCQVAILDISMPGMNGLEVASIIRNRHPDASIIFLTAFDEFSYAKKAIEVRALDYLLKPGSDADLVNVLEEAFRHCDMKRRSTDAGRASAEVRGERVDSWDGEVRGVADGCRNLQFSDVEAGGCRDDVPEPNSFMKKVREYIDENFQDDIALQDIAGAFGYSDVYFCKLFKQNFEVNFITFLNDYRMERAKEFLADPLINIKDISQKAGYRDANYFTRVFKRSVGMTPSEYRSEVGNT